MCRLASFAAASVILVGSALAFGQTPPVQAQPGMAPPAAGQAPQRDKPVAKTGTAAIKGRIVTAERHFVQTMGPPKDTAGAEVAWFR